MGLVLATMSLFTEKLTSMETRLLGFALDIDETSVQKSSSRKSYSREHSKKNLTHLTKMTHFYLPHLRVHL